MLFPGKIASYHIRTLTNVFLRLYPAEINSIGMRTKGAALASASDWLFNYFIVQLTPLGIHHLHWKFYIIFFVLNACFVPIVYLFFPETAGKSLEEIDLMFTGEKRYIVAGMPSKMPKRRYTARDVEEMSLISERTDGDANDAAPRSSHATSYDSDDGQDLGETDDAHVLGSDSDDDFDTIDESKKLSM